MNTDRPHTPSEVLRDPELALNALGPNGPGAMQIYPFFHGLALTDMQREIQDPTRVYWEPAADPKPNARGIVVAQNFDVFALRIGAGDQRPFDRLSATMRAKQRIVQFVHNLSVVFPSLAAWEPTELGLHRYYDEDVGISFHRDNRRFVGVIAILSVLHRSELKIRQDERDTSIQRFRTYPGLLTLLRASYLIPDMPELLCPDHEIADLDASGRVSMQLRQNNRPEEVVEGFNFANWQPDQPH